ncbi:hypothetical protein OXX69_013310, partial [Metschnikowia pulcherrima]
MATVASAELSADILAGNVRKSISEETYNRSLAETFTELVSKNSGFKTAVFDPQKHLAYYAQGPLQQHKYEKHKAGNHHGGIGAYQQVADLANRR